VLTHNTTGINIGCDLGKLRDYTAFSVAEAQLRGDDEHFNLRRLERAMLGTDYTAIAARLNQLYERTTKLVDDWNESAPERKATLQRNLDAAERDDPSVPLLQAQIRACDQPQAKPQIWLDVTGLGGPFLDFLMKQHGHLPVVAVTITGGDRDRQQWEPSGYQILHVGKEALVGRLQVLLGSGRIHIANDAGSQQAARELEHELKVFEGRTTSAKHVKYAAKEGEHDDLVIAAALSAWQRAQSAGERVQVF